MDICSPVPRVPAAVYLFSVPGDEFVVWYRPVPGWVAEKLRTAAGASERTLKRPFDRLGCPLDAVLMACHVHERFSFLYLISFVCRSKFNMFSNMRIIRLGYIITLMYQVSGVSTPFDGEEASVLINQILISLCAEVIFFRHASIAKHKNK